MKAEIVIIGGGCAGISAAIGAYEAGARNILLIEREDSLGGILNQCLHEGFGLEKYGQELTGPQFAEKLLAEMPDIGLALSSCAMNISHDLTVTYQNASGIHAVSAKAVILASGCRETPIGALPVSGTRPSGIFTAGQAQRMMNLGGYDIGDDVVILGSGDVGLIVAGMLKNRGKNVIAVIEREDNCTGLERNRVNCLEKYNIPLITDTTVTRVHGAGRIESVDIKNCKTGEETNIPCKTLITSVGLIPEREIIDFPEALPPGIILCGNCRFVFDTADMASADGYLAGKQAAEYVLNGVFPAPMPVPEKHIPHDNAALCTDCPRGCLLKITPHGLSGGVCGRYKLQNTAF